MTLIITDEDVERLLPMEECIAAMRVAFRDFAAGDAVNRPRLRYLAKHPDPALQYMANVHCGAVPSAGVACVRAGSQILRPAGPSNDRRSYENPSAFNWGLVILYSLETAEPLALMHEFALSGMRVGATSGAAVAELAHKDAGTLGLYGTGKQARSALEAIVAVRPIRSVSVYSPSPEHRAQFAVDMARQGVNVIAVDTPRAVVQGADIVCCATNAMGAVLDGNWLEDGQVVVSIANSDVTNKRSEVDKRTFQRARAVIINDWESVEDNKQTELTDRIGDKTLARDRVFELGALLSGKVALQPVLQARTDGRDILYYKNNSGLAIQFAAAGAVIYRKALDEGRCKEIPSAWLGSDLSALYAKGFRPSP